MPSWLLRPSFQACLVFALITALLITIAWLFKPVIFALLVSFTLYAILEPVNNQMTGRGLSPASSATIILCILAGLSTVFTFIGFPKLLDGILALQQKFSILKDTLYAWIEKLQFLLEKSGIQVDEASISQYLQGANTELNLDVIIQGSNILLDISGTLLLVPFIVFFLLRDYKSSRNRLLSLLPNEYFEMGWSIYYRVARQLQGYIKGVIIQTSILATVATTGFFIVGFESAVMLGVFAGLFGIIPYLGPVLALMPPLMLAMSIQPFDVYYVWAAVAVIGVAYIFDNLVVIPTIIANAVDLHPFVVIVGVIIFGSMFGIVGTILALPIMATSKILFVGLYQGFSQRASVIRTYAEG
ncbi:AI-2E family transporter [Litoribrevibacter albus]|uniref:AI-2E family transporter n=1 Tax=Litoribrevibacter albus TaxID=1473156 RepID=A0AA37W6V6_9GAMM|nr:AI-2E family transporter [Litoribrevibacter albus]GLQ29876.1 AI-2E family transporter [Litoribrevibacter albus]